MYVFLGTELEKKVAIVNIYAEDLAKRRKSHTLLLGNKNHTTPLSAGGKFYYYFLSSETSKNFIKFY